MSDLLAHPLREAVYPCRVCPSPIIRRSPGETLAHAVENAAALEEVARLALQTEALNPAATTTPQAIMDKHFLRKHGKDAYYGQPRR